MRQVPVIGCWVTHADRKGSRGVVVDRDAEDEAARVQVQWHDGTQQWHDVAELRNGIRPGDAVQDSPVSNTRKPLGVGTAIATREIAGSEQVSVQLHATGESRWLPYERLVRIKDAEQAFISANATELGGERFRVKSLAYALDSWNQVTGALDRLDVDPLPHQIDLVHRIMRSDQRNWLIADDVGLGKTIEVGLLLAALKRRRQARRALVVCPAGVVRQWQDEMQYKFNQDFEIYGVDFNINHPSRWTGKDKVIVSIDRAKNDDHSPIFGNSGEWDVIVFDEAHHLNKMENHSATLRYRLAEKLRGMTDSFIFLTGTPHQGKTAQFINLLLLLRPDLRSRFANARTNPAVVAEVVLRNRKSLATDANGRFLFRGQDTHLIETPPSASMESFDMKLETYLRYGYDAAAVGGDKGRAIGFVMTTYRKLASSSIAAIERALQRRLDRLQGIYQTPAARLSASDLRQREDEFAEGMDANDDLDAVADSAAGVNPFFEDEQAQIVELLKDAAQVKKDDVKLKRFFSAIVNPLAKQGERLLIFTEYRATQDYLIQELAKRYPKVGVAQINGSMKLNDKRSNIADFNETAQFMVSTEAGGEGLNLHGRCHILANYDLPWNPGRLVQRAGRLYRYGQQERVVVFNLMSSNSFDDKALKMMLERVHSIAQDMSSVGSEFHDGMETEIIGELLERVDVASILADNRTMDINRTASEIDQAIARAEDARTMQESLFSHIESYNRQNATAMYAFGERQILAFLESALPLRGVEIRDRLYRDPVHGYHRVLELELPDEMRGEFSEFPGRAAVVRVTASRELAALNPRLRLMDFASPFFVSLIDFAQSPSVEGEYSNLIGPESGALGIYKLRWQDDQGEPRWEALLPIFLPKGGNAAIANPDFFGSLLTEAAENEAASCAETAPEYRKELLKRMEACAHEELARQCTALRHPNDATLLMSADLTSV